tara:strand:- start:188 stop:1048 length:861 start_codon:yes stop_codon:yes gene_type:complete
MRIGVIADGVSREVEHAFKVIRGYGINNVELQYVWDKEIGDLSDIELQRLIGLLDKYHMNTVCISRHNFSGIEVSKAIQSNPEFIRQMDAFRRCIDTARQLDCQLIRIMGMRKEMVLFGYGGAEEWNVAKGAWDMFVEVTRSIVSLAQSAGVTLVIETGNGGMVNSAHLGARLCREIDSSSLKVLWDPANCLFSGESPIPEGYESIKNHLAHVHIKDTRAWISRATLEQVPYGDGHLGPYLADIAKALSQDGYEGVVSYESVHRPKDGAFEDGFHGSVQAFLRDFS